MDAIKTINPKDIESRKLHHYLLAAVAPRPIAFASTIDSDGQVNLSPFSFFNVFSSNPPVMIFSPARSGRDGTLKHTHQNILEVPEVVINTVNYDMVQQMSLASSSYKKGINEFTKSGLSEIPSELIKPPRVKESPIAFECTVREVIPLGEHGGAGNLVICEVLLIHIHDQFLVNSKLDTTSLDLVGRMGDNWYCRASSKALFEVQKPGIVPGIGVDQLPTSVFKSQVLTGNQIGRLAGLASLPTKVEILKHREELDTRYLEDEIENHKYAQTLIHRGQIRSALTTILALNFDN